MSRISRRPIIATPLHRDITMIGASAGGIGAFQKLLRNLPSDYPAAVFAVLHLPPESPSVLANVLDRCSRLPVEFAVSGSRIRCGTVTFAPPDTHLFLEADRVLLSRGPRENRHRPSIDVLFRSAAVAYGPRVTGVILSGRLDDGSAGLWAVKRRGGATVVEDPDDAEFRICRSTRWSAWWSIAVCRWTRWLRRSFNSQARRSAGRPLRERA